MRDGDLFQRRRHRRNVRNVTPDLAYSQRLIEQSNYWENQFGGPIATRLYGKTFVPHQWDRDKAALFRFEQDGVLKGGVMPDMTVLDGHGEHHEIKHKSPKVFDGVACFGTEEYRLRMMWLFWKLTKQPVYLTIHDHSGLPLGANDLTNRLEDWYTVNIAVLTRAVRDGHVFKTRWGGFVNQVWKERLPGFLWERTLWQRLERVWGPPLPGRKL